MTDRKHGTNAKYAAEGCRCQPCTDANHCEANNRRRQIAYGRWQPYVDAEPVRQHVRLLLASGLGWQRVANVAGVSRGTVEKLLYGARHRNLAPSKRIRPENAERLLAVVPDEDAKAAGALSDGTGTRRRLQALVVAGWPQVRLATELGMDRTNFNKTIHADQVRTSTKAAARTLYDQLWRTDPRGRGVTNHSYSRSVNLGRANGWAPVGCWDDATIDDPQAFPDWTGRCGTTQGYWAHFTAGLPVCAACSDAKRADRAARKAAA